MRVLLAFGAHENPGFGEVLINLGVALLSGCARQTLVAEPTAAPPGPYSNAGSPAHGADGAAGGLGTDGRME